MKALCISDTHGFHKTLKSKFDSFFERDDIDLILHAGDVSSRGSFAEVSEFMVWYASLDQFKYKVFIAGNHDFAFEREAYGFYPKLIIPENIIYLHNSGVEIEGVKFWGSPYTPRFFDWAFNVDRGEEIKKHWDLIPDDVDVLITHGPAKGVGDFTYRDNKNVGCEELVGAIHRVNPQYHIYGHIHEGYGSYRMFDTFSINASSLDVRYGVSNEPIIIEI
jgi:Icc-related predicted phosphoesterase